MSLILLLRLFPVALQLSPYMIPVNVVNVHRARGTCLLEFYVPVQIFHYIWEVRK